MTFEEKQGLCYRIVTGYSIIEHKNAVYHVYDPRPVDIHNASVFYERRYNELLLQGCLTEDDAASLLEERQIWNIEQDKLMDSLEGQLKNLRSKLPLFEFRSLEKQALLNNVDKLELQIKTLKKTRDCLLINTCEHVAALDKYRYLVFLLAKLPGGKSVWSDYCEFINSEEYLINKMLSSCYFTDNITEGVIRELARSDPWRTFWNTALKVGDLFGRPVIDMTELQRVLVSWSMIYDGVYESMECPDEEVINNDALLDGWLEQQHLKRKEERGKNNNKYNNNKAGEIGIVVNTPEDAAKVYNLNDKNALSVVAQREKFIKTHGNVTEDKLPDVNTDIRTRLNRMEAEYKRNSRIK